LATGGYIIAVLPHAVLAATLIAISVPRLVDVPGFLRLWQGWRAEGVIALVAAVALVVFGVLKGVLIAVLLAAAQMLRRSAHPHDAVLAVTNPGEPAHEVDEHRHPRLDVLIYRVDAPLFFANIARVADRIRALASACGPHLRYLILDAGAVFYLDATAAQTMADLTVDLRERGRAAPRPRSRAGVGDAAGQSIPRRGHARPPRICQRPAGLRTCPGEGGATA
jgi:MFS superfamily sulfate permease-like transporter